MNVRIRNLYVWLSLVIGPFEVRNEPPPSKQHEALLGGYDSVDFLVRAGPIESDIEHLPLLQHNRRGRTSLTGICRRIAAFVYVHGLNIHLGVGTPPRRRETRGGVVGTHNLG